MNTHEDRCGGLIGYAAALLLTGCAEPRISFPPLEPVLYPIELAGPIINTPQVAVVQSGGADHAVVVWEQNGRIHGRTYLHPAGMPSPCCWAAQVDLGPGDQPDTAMDASGRAIAAWRNWNEIDGRTFDPARGWQNQE